MNNRKNQNSILVLATLGVYLGLVLAGATPQVLAQAATAKQFNVKDEVEVQDEFDNNPDIGELKSLITNSLEKTLVSFFRDVKASNLDAPSRTSLHRPHSVTTLRNFCGPEWIESSGIMLDSRDSLEQLHSDLYAGWNWNFESVPRFVQTQEGPSKQKFCKAFSLTTSLDSKELSFKLLLSRTDSLNAFRLAGYLNDFLIGRSHNFQDPLTRQVYQYTRATSDYANLVIVTRLPRAGLDSLLASDAK